MVRGRTGFWLDCHCNEHDEGQLQPDCDIRTQSWHFDSVRTVLSVQIASGLRWFCVVCFGVASVRHATDLWHGGWLPYEYFPLWTNIFWTALTFLDPLAALLLWLRPRPGACLALLVMLADVGVNGFWVSQTAISGTLGVATLLAQTLYLGIVLGGFPLLWSLSSSPEVHKP
jgi:hypothetical protein